MNITGCVSRGGGLGVCMFVKLCKGMIVNNALVHVLTGMSVCIFVRVPGCEYDRRRICVCL